MKGNGNDAVDAVHALRARGVDQAEALLADADPDEIVAACRRFDRRQGRVGPGWLVSEIRAGHYTDPEPEPTVNVTDRLRATFAEHQARLPVGTAVGRCVDPECPGIVHVEESSYPVLILQCSVCRTIDGAPVSMLHRIRAYHPPHDPNLPF